MIVKRDPETGDHYRTLIGHNLAILSMDIENSGQGSM